MPARYVLDAHAWIEYLRGSSPGKRVKELMESSSVYTSSLTLADVVAHVEKDGQDSNLAARAIQSMSEIVDVDSALSLSAAKRFARMKGGSLEQSYLIEISKKLGAEIVTGDKNIQSARVIYI
jgi:PIN domain nuclease of toxin-antitoxin system